MNPDLPRRIVEFLRRHQVLTLATADEEGPHAAALYYAADDDLNLYVLSDPATRHGRAMASGQLVAGTIQRDRQNRDQTTGLQFRARCERLEAAARARAWALYVARFAFLKTPSTAVASALVKTPLWRLTPSWIRLIDGQRGFGFKEEWTR